MEWLAYYRMEPWGPERADLNAGIIASTLANIHRDSTKRPKPFAPSDFMPKFGEREEPKPEGMTSEEILAAFDRIIEQQQTIGKIVRRA